MLWCARTNQSIKISKSNMQQDNKIFDVLDLEQLHKDVP